MVFSSGFSALAADGAEIKTLENYSRLVLPVAAGANFQVSGGDGDIRLDIDHTKISAMGALSALQDKRIAAVSTETRALDKARVNIRLGRTDQEFFAYYQASPPAVIVDVWTKEGVKEGGGTVQTKAIASVNPKKSRSPASLKPAHTAASVKKPAPKAEVPVEEFKPKVESFPLVYGKDLFEKFPQALPELEVESTVFPLPLSMDFDRLWTFTKPDTKQPDGQAFALAQRLASQKKYGLAIKTIDIAERDNPDSEYKNEMDFFRLVTLRKLGLENKAAGLVANAENSLKELAARKQPSGEAMPFDKAIRFFFAARMYGESRWYDTLRELESLAKEMSIKNKDFPALQLVIADIYAKVKEYQRADRLYRYLEEHYPVTRLAKEASFRQADQYALEQNYRRTIEEGKDALERYPEYALKRNEIYFNMGEAYFWTGDFKRSEASFRKFLKVNPAATIGALAYVRLGELAEIQRKDLKEASELYLQARNSYPFSYGDKIASIRLARIQLAQEKDLGYQIRLLEEIRGSEGLDLDTRRNTDLTLIDYYIQAGNADRAISIARSGLGESDGALLELFKKDLIKGLFYKAVELNRDKKFAATVALYDKEKSLMDAYGADVYRVLAEAYRGLGLFDSSNKYMESYQAARRKNGRGVASVDPGVKLEKMRNSYAQGNYADALQQADGLEENLEILEVKAVANQELKRFTEAYAAAGRSLKRAAELKVTNPEAVTDERLEKIALVVIDAGGRSRNFMREEDDLSAIRKLVKNKSETVEFALADALWYQNRHKEALKAYEAAIEAFPQSVRIDRSKYQMGMSYLALGKREQAVKTLTELRDKSQTIWAQSAKQELDLIEWETKYSSVLRSLPPSGLGISN